MRQFLTNAVRQTNEYQQILHSIENGHHVTAINGIWENAAAMFLLTLMADQPRNYLVIGANDSEAKAFYEAALAMDPDTCYFPTKDLVLFDAYAHSHEILNERIRTLRQLVFDPKPPYDCHLCGGTHD